MTRLPKFPPALARGCVLILIACILGACGFHLRNALSIPADVGPLRVVAKNRYSPLATALSEELGRAGAVPAPDDATTGVAILKINSERWGNSPLSVDVRGRAQEHTLRYAVVFQMTRADGSVLVPEQVIELSRDYISVVTRSAGTEGEREILTEELRKAMVASILRRLDLAFKNPPPIAPPPVAAPADGTGDTPPVPAAEPSAPPEPVPPSP